MSKQLCAERNLASRIASSVAMLGVLILGIAFETHAQSRERRNYDGRAEYERIAVEPPTLEQLDAIEARRSRSPGLAATFDRRTGATRTLLDRVGYLTEEQSGDPVQIALDFARGETSLLGLDPSDLAEYEITDVVPSRVSGATHVYLRQVHRGIPVYNGQLQIHVNRRGRILGLSNHFMPRAALAANVARPAIGPSEAVARAAQHLGLPAGEAAPAEGGSSRRPRSASEAPVSLEPIAPRLMWLPIRRGEMRLVWNFQIHTLDRQHVFDLTVDAETGQVWTRIDWVATDSYRVYGRPSESPNHTSPLPPSDGRQLISNPSAAQPSPAGWHSTGSSSYTTMRGNNVHAYHDSDGNNVPPGSEPSCGSSRNCSFSINLSQHPSSYTGASIANLFYWTNLVHDIQYRYGFDEAAGNFQANNFGRGGVGGDDLRAEAQDGGGVNNGNFYVPPDGFRPRMQMYLWNKTSPARDGSLDASVIAHEYGHGISIRQVGGPMNSSCLGNKQQPGEGWSDFFALVYTTKSEHRGTDRRGIATYLMGHSVTGKGIRSQPYSTDPSVNTHTYASIAGKSVPHGVGEVWAQALWEMYWALVNQHGFDPNLANVSAGKGNHRALLYVNEGLKNTACSPTFTDARDGIIQAAVDNYSGQDVCLLWKSFAAFGLGIDAVSGGSASTSPTNGFDIPSACKQTTSSGFMNWTSTSTLSYSGQDGSGTVTAEDGGSTYFLKGNRWRRTSQTFTITPYTVLEFDFQSTAQGEVHGIGFDEDNLIDNHPRIFQLYGTQNWANSIRIYHLDYKTLGSYVKYRIPVGAFYTGSGFRLVLANDKDSGTLNNTSRFRNVRVYEKVPTAAPLNFNLLQTTGYAGQDFSGTVAPEENGLTLLLQGNRWRRSTQSFTLTKNTVVSFQFKSTAQGEIHGIGFDQDNVISGNRIFKLLGTQPWGINGFRKYGSGDLGTFKTFVIPAGRLYQGTGFRLVLANDKDTGTLNNNSRFRNVRIYELQ